MRRTAIAFVAVRPCEGWCCCCPPFGATDRALITLLFTSGGIDLYSTNSVSQLSWFLFCDVAFFMTIIANDCGRVDWFEGNTKKR